MQVSEDPKESQNLPVAETSDSRAPGAGSAFSLGSPTNTEFLYKLNQISAF